jgi:hypothetical protein
MNKENKLEKTDEVPPSRLDEDVIKSIHNSVCTKSSSYKAEWLGCPYIFENHNSWCELRRCNLCGLEFINYRISRHGKPQTKVWKGADTRLD